MRTLHDALIDCREAFGWIGPMPWQKLHALDLLVRARRILGDLWEPGPPASALDATMRACQALRTDHLERAKQEVAIAVTELGDHLGCALDDPCKTCERSLEAAAG